MFSGSYKECYPIPTSCKCEEKNAQNNSLSFNTSTYAPSCWIIWAMISLRDVHGAGHGGVGKDSWCISTPSGWITWAVISLGDVNRSLTRIDIMNNSLRNFRCSLYWNITVILFDINNKNDWKTLSIAINYIVSP